MVENIECSASDGPTSTVKLTGYIRGTDLNVNRLIHIPGWGDFQLQKVEKHADPRAAKKDTNMVDVSSVEPSNELQDDLITENEPDVITNLFGELPNLGKFPWWFESNSKQKYMK